VATPEQTVERLLEAAARGDVKALAELLDPEFLKKMGITKEAFVKMLGQYPVDSGMKNVQFRDMKFKVEYGKDGTANVSPVSGEVIYTDENGKVHTEKVTEEDTKQPLKLVKRDGTWYVSIDDEILSGLEELIDDPKPERVEVPDNGDWAGPTTDGKVN